MKKTKRNALARRERQIMDVLYKLKSATVGQVLEVLPDQRNYSTVRAQLRVLEEKGHVRHEEQGLDMSRQAVTKHLKRLEEAGLVATIWEGPGKISVPKPGANP